MSIFAKRVPGAAWRPRRCRAASTASRTNQGRSERCLRRTPDTHLDSPAKEYCALQCNARNVTGFLWVLHVLARRAVREAPLMYMLRMICPESPSTPS
eukprot:6576269-Pyramimonas_sp.AAC.2